MCRGLLSWHERCFWYSGSLSLLIKKLELYGFDNSMTSWISSYLTGRSQCVSIDGCLSRLLPVPQGVPQGSILGPLLYTIFTNELPEIIHGDQNCSRQAHPDAWPPYSMSCKSCGSLTCYADDSTYSCSSSDPEILKNLQQSTRSCLISLSTID